MESKIGVRTTWPAQNLPRFVLKYYKYLIKIESAVLKCIANIHPALLLHIATLTDENVI